MQHFRLNCKGNLVEIKAPVVMGILNLTPDSFFDGGKYGNEVDVLVQVDKMLYEGAAIIDVGGFSTRPNAELVAEEEEVRRVVPMLQLIHQYFPQAILSIDTFRSKVAEEAVKNGASIINDISGGTEDEHIFEVAANYHCPLILMHHQGNIHTMHQQTSYTDFLSEVTDFFTQQIHKAQKAGVKDVIIDAGFGFSKTLEHNYSLLKHLKLFTIFGKPLLVGVSRKSMLYKPLGITAKDALNVTTIANTIALHNGAGILRVHDVKEAMECIQLYNLMNNL